MSRVLIYMMTCGFAIVLQTVLLPTVIPAYYKPDLILVLVVFLGLHERLLPGSLLVYLIGWFCDAFAGVFDGLYGFALLSLFLAVRGIVTRVNAESVPLFLILIAFGTLIHALLIIFALDFFKVTDSSWSVIFSRMPIQMLLNVLAGIVFLKLFAWFPKTFFPASDSVGLRKLKKRYEP